MTFWQHYSFQFTIYIDAYVKVVLIISQCVKFVFCILTHPRSGIIGDPTKSNSTGI